MTAVQERPPAAGEPAGEQQPEEITRGVGASILLGLLAFLGFAAGVSALLIVLGVILMIFMHELGHYVMAKRAGMKVTEYFLGFGPRIWSFHRGETEYGIKAIPAGAYVRIVGMNNLDEYDPADAQRTYMVKPYRHQLGVAVAGSAMHFLMATAMVFVLMAFVGLTDFSSWTVRSDPSTQSAAEAAGIQQGDEIVSVDGQDVSAWDDFGDVVQSRKGEAVAVEVVRNGETVILETRIGERLTADGAAPLDGIEAGNRILAVDGEAVANYAEFVALVGDGESHAVTIDTNIESGDVQLRVDADDLVVADDATTGFFGVGPEFGTSTESIATASYKSFEVVGRTIWDASKALGRVFTPSGLADFFGGAVESDEPAPAVRQTTADGDENRLLSLIGAVQIGTTATDDDGLAGFLGFFIILNVFVGVFNLVPLPPLDGGHVVFATYEKIRSMIAGERYHGDYGKLIPAAYAVIGLLVMIGIVAIYRDIVDPIAQ